MSLLIKLVKDQTVISLPPSVSVMDAVHKMAEYHIGSIVVMEEGTLVGIFTERDLMNRAVDKKINLNETLLSEVMSKNVTTVSVHESVDNCFKKMQETKCRHIPIVDGAKVVGIVTMRNILEFLIDEMRDENVQLKNYIQS